MVYRRQIDRFDQLTEHKPTLSPQQEILLSNPFTNRYKLSKIETSSIVPR
jgi:hypothetical protein